jgi:chaperone modulatory protein CbpM
MLPPRPDPDLERFVADWPEGISYNPRQRMGADMADAEEFRALADLDEDTLEAWRSAGWLRPREGAGGLVYAEIDVARAQLIRDLRDDFGINDEGVTVVLDLVDQLHGLRRSLREILAGLEAEPEATRRRILAALGTAADRG